MTAFVRGPLLALLLTLAALPALLAPAAAAGVPTLDLAKWNQAYKLTVTNLTDEQKIAVLPYSTCSKVGYEQNPDAVELNSCFYKKDSDGTNSFWTKLPGDRRDDGNCYCYALNVHKGGFCLPGKANGTDDAIMAADLVTCDLMSQAVVADGGKQVSREEALSGQPNSGHYIAIMVRGDDCNPYHCWGTDFHAARKDSNGLWSWKQPAGPASNTDIFGNTIKDPESAIMFGHYDEFCGYFQVDPDSMTIGGTFDEQTLEDQAKRYKELGGEGVQVKLEATRYNATVDGAFDSSEEEHLDADLLWESKRGSKEWEEYYKKDEAAISNGSGSGSSSGSSNVGGGGSSNKGSQGSTTVAQSGRRMLRNKGAVTASTIFP